MHVLNRTDVARQYRRYMRPFWILLTVVMVVMGTLVVVLTLNDSPAHAAVAPPVVHHRAAVDITQEPLVHHDFKVMTPTAYCSNHQQACVDELARRFQVQLNNHPNIRSNFSSDDNKAAWHDNFNTAWHNKFDSCLPGCGKRARSLPDDWAGFAGDPDRCFIRWDSTPWNGASPYTYDLDCVNSMPPSNLGLSSGQKFAIACGVTTLVTIGATVAGVATAGTVSPGSAVAISVSSNALGCAATGFFLDWMKWKP